MCYPIISIILTEAILTLGDSRAMKYLLPGSDWVSELGQSASWWGLADEGVALGLDPQLQIWI